MPGSPVTAMVAGGDVERSRRVRDKSSDYWLIYCCQITQDHKNCVTLPVATI